MRNFVYLDDEILNSFLAQIDEGIVESLLHEVKLGKEVGNTNSNGSNVKINGELNAAVVKSKGEIELNHNKIKQESSNEIITDVQNKKLHDFAFDKLINYISENDFLKRQNCIGDFISINENILICDYQTIIDIINDKNGILSYIKKTQTKQIEESLNNEMEKMSREQKRDKIVVQELQKKLKEATKSIDNQWNDTKDILDAIFSIIPYKRVIQIEDKIIIPNDKFFRDDINVLSFKYGGKMKVLGCITNIISNDVVEQNTNSSFIEALRSINSLINTTLITMTSTEKQLYIITPIAIYYE
ncbi:MAG: hypothetical protein N2749_01265 [Clostridia bacterium]|nr:hypothetical protein [Clostridia bacterium]